MSANQRVDASKRQIPLRHRLDWEIERHVLPFEDWMLFGACRDADLQQFFPVSGNSHPHRAKSICNLCVYKAQCLDYAMHYEIDDGIWGGMTRNERRRLKPFRLDREDPSPPASAHG